MKPPYPAPTAASMTAPQPRPTHAGPPAEASGSQDQDGRGQDGQGERAHRGHAEHLVVERGGVAEHVDAGQRLVHDVDQVADHAERVAAETSSVAVKAAAIECANARHCGDLRVASRWCTWLMTTANSTAARDREQPGDHARTCGCSLLPPLEELGVAGVVRHVDAGDGQEDARRRRGPRRRRRPSRRWRPGLGLDDGVLVTDMAVLRSEWVRLQRRPPAARDTTEPAPVLQSGLTLSRRAATAATMARMSRRQARRWRGR